MSDLFSFGGDSGSGGLSDSVMRSPQSASASGPTIINNYSSSQTIHAKDAPSFKQSAAQIAADQRRAMMRR